jgi:hypothetical protein
MLLKWILEQPGSSFTDAIRSQSDSACRILIGKEVIYISHSIVRITKEKPNLSLMRLLEFRRGRCTKYVSNVSLWSRQLRFF